MLNMLLDVSIRAPVMGATQALEGGELQGGVSIRAPVMGATSASLGRAIHALFQSAPP